MSDNKSMNDGRDRSRVDSQDPSEVEYLHRQYPNLTHEQVLNTVKQAGPLRSDIERELEILSGTGK
jgi:hypothetical protein